jgi:hypothetical protein
LNPLNFKFLNKITGVKQKVLVSRSQWWLVDERLTAKWLLLFL